MVSRLPHWVIFRIVVALLRDCRRLALLGLTGLPLGSRASFFGPVPTMGSSMAPPGDPARMNKTWGRRDGIAPSGSKLSCKLVIWLERMSLRSRGSLSAASVVTDRRGPRPRDTMMSRQLFPPRVQDMGNETLQMLNCVRFKVDLPRIPRTAVVETHLLA
ncbi:hypothetical protein Pden_3137 [Paracoccus denitrificans PD1222]|uniref:Uncharacterized protein n=1 Tax=Paracoccus denitrificans (strain Pd 1222) TaxID=318586 RepID=A1B6S4_PARDP|nr:hypothetical protein Pden_3137 [Paracoccus denitrificans PD1222]